jgi:glycosyltransferase involved in cell wall biosynthesis
LPKVAVLLCTYHGQHYLADQLDSIERQTYQNWEVWASDDGSEDDTHAILKRYQEKWGVRRISLHYGPEEGFVSNFLSLTCKADIKADCYAYSDQDDIWEDDKLQRAMDWLRSVPEGVPALYCSRTRLVDADNREIGLSPLFSRPPSFANALMQNIGGGNTMVFNEAARVLLREAGESVEVVSHDSWAYMVVTGCGGKVKYDTYPTLRYRQHGNNVVGMNSDWAARRVRIRMLWQGHLRTWNDRHLVALQRLQPHLTPESQYTLELLAKARKRSLVPRLVGLKKSGIYRQTLLGNLGLLAAAIFKKI